MPNLTSVLEDLDAIHRTDPVEVIHNGTPIARASLGATTASRWLLELVPHASDELRIAVHAHHVARWTVPRESYELGRAGYFTWRSDLAKQHALIATQIMARRGYAEPSQKRVETIIRKRGLKTDPEVQALEDAACLEFLELEFHDFAPKHDYAKVVDIVRKTWRKMSAAAHAKALTLAESWEPEDVALVQEALRPE